MGKENLREISADTLLEILERGQFSHIYLKLVLDKYAYLEKNERAFITRLVNGTVERKLELDYIINSYSKTKTNKMKPMIRTMLRMGVFEIYYMDGVPDSATCNEYVKLAKKRGFSGLSGFVNGVLRSVARDKGNVKISDPAVVYSMPQWIMDMWKRDFGNDTAVDIAKGFFEQQELCVRVNESKGSRDELIELLQAEGITASADENLSSALYISGYDSVGQIKAFNDGLFYVQDYSSQLVANWAEIASDNKVLDVCAAPGGKSLHAAMLAKNGSVEARDLTEQKVALIEENIKRAGVDNVTAKQWDATVLDETAVDAFDVVIADLPCSGLGIIRKKPDIKYNQTQESLSELVELQSQILEVVCQYVKARGTLVYSTCTINKAENEDQVRSFVASHPEYKVIKQEQLYPTKEHDGFFICVMKR